MPEAGKVNAATVAAYTLTSFPHLKLALVVGVCGAVPYYPVKDVGNGKSFKEVILGDVILSTGVVQYDLGWRYDERLETKDTLRAALGRPTQKLRAHMTMMNGIHARKRLQAAIKDFLAKLQQEPELAARYPGVAKDKLIQYCEGSKDIPSGYHLILRDRLALNQQDPIPDTAVHFGLVASGDSVIMSAQTRNRIQKEKGVIAFEMESAGVWDVLPCIVIKGVSDYADAYKDKSWQRYASATAAACMKAFLATWGPSTLGA